MHEDNRLETGDSGEIQVRTVGIFAKPNAPLAVKLVPELLEWLAVRGVGARLDVEAARYAGFEGLDRDEVPEGCDLAIILGGDGTLLSAARAVGRRAIPLLAVNLGGLGFLTTITVEDFFDELARALRCERRISRRKMIQVSLVRNGQVQAIYQALNDVVIAKSSIARIVDLEAWINDGFVSKYKADGLIISTPTGSTAYSLAAGGPIIYPTVSAFCLTPICPHTLTNRPLIIPAELGVRVVNRALHDEAYLTVDGQVGSPLEAGDSVECVVADFDVLLIRPPHKTFFEVLRQKLKWGQR
jgi:NAD+ kinase